MKNRRHQRGLTSLVLVITGLCATGTALAQNHGQHWTYHGQHADPSHWATLSSDFEACGRGQQQSPIDIRKTVKSQLPALEFQYTAVEPTLVNNGHTVQVNLPKGSTLKLGDAVYELLQFHFHTPSEEAVAGKHAAMVAHFVHRNANNELAVVGVLLQPGKNHPGFAPIFEHLPRPGESIQVEGLKLDIAALLPDHLGYYAYQGSLTTPPCAEGVRWMVLKEPVKLGTQQIKAFRRLFNANARPIQPLNGREVHESL